MVSYTVVKGHNQPQRQGLKSGARTPIKDAMAKPAFKTAAQHYGAAAIHSQTAGAVIR